MTEIILLVLGMLIFILSFLIPTGSKKKDTNESWGNEEKIREIIDKEVQEAKGQISDIVDETITYSMEKTERAMERISNEKIMAVNEYSDTVLQKIDKNHQEAVFLYDMLNEKHESLKAAVSEAMKTATEVKQTVRDAEITAKEAEEKVREVQEAVTFVPINPERIEIPEEKPKKRAARKPKAEKTEKAFKDEKAVLSENTEKAKKDEQVKPEEKTEKAKKVDLSLSTDSQADSKNNNERILELHKAGKSNMAIAKELGLGIGEVKLVIDLFKGI